MGQAAAQYPGQTWDGSSKSRKAPAFEIDRAPDNFDWDQIVAEVQAVEDGNASVRSQVTPTAWVDLTLANSWTNKATYAKGGYRKRNTEVFLRGSISPGTLTDGTAVATLPAGFRPTTKLSMPVIAAAGDANDANPTILIGSDGTLKVYGLTSQASIDLSSIRFFTDQ